MSINSDDILNTEAFILNTTFEKREKSASTLHREYELDKWTNFYKFQANKKLKSYLEEYNGIVEEWTLKGTYIEAANFGTMDYATSDPVEIALTLKYDYAILQF